MQVRRSRGFTLLELLVVLLLVALVTGLVAPSVMRNQAAARERGMAADLRALLEGLPLRAFARGSPQSYDDAALVGLLGQLPEGWEVKVATPLAYSGAGVAEGGDVLLTAPGRMTLAFRVLPISGEVAPVNARP